jgi:patatin-like phospholipase/acyl hydrolase
MKKTSYLIIISIFNLLIFSTYMSYAVEPDASPGFEDNSSSIRKRFSFSNSTHRGVIAAGVTLLTFFMYDQHKKNYPILALAGSPRNQKTKRILIIDGGGIRGVIPAQILTRFESELQHKFDRDIRIAECFDLIAGTSTGGIIALGLSVPTDRLLKTPKYKASDLLELYKQNGTVIFPETNLYDRARSYVEPKFVATPLENILRSYFGRYRLSDSVTRTFITTYDVLKDTPEFFRSYTPVSRSKRGIIGDYQKRKQGVFSRYPRQKQLLDTFLMRDVARATSAAPTYFEGVKMYSFSGQEHCFIDGGVAVNNPTVAAILEARKIFGDEVKHYVVLSLGTGEMSSRNYWPQINQAGKLQWASVIPEVMMTGASQLVDAQVKALNEELAKQGITIEYTRIQPSIHPEHAEMDDANAGNISKLIAIADKAANEPKAAGQLKKIVDGLKNEEEEKEKGYKTLMEKWRVSSHENYKFAKLKMQQGKWREAIDLLKKSSDNCDFRSLLMLARIFEHVYLSNPMDIDSLKFAFLYYNRAKLVNEALGNLRVGEEGLKYQHKVLYRFGTLGLKSIKELSSEQIKTIEEEVNFDGEDFNKKLQLKKVQGYLLNIFYSAPTSLGGVIGFIGPRMPPILVSAKTLGVPFSFQSQYLENLISDSTLEGYSKALFWSFMEGYEIASSARPRVLYGASDIEDIRYELACSGFKEAQRDLAVFFEEEKNNPEEAEKWYRRAAWQDDTEAKYRLAKLLAAKNTTIKKDINSEELYWLLSAANDDHVNSQFETGRFYEDLYNNEPWRLSIFPQTFQNLKQALFWYKKAANQGHEEAKKKVKALE